MTSKINSSFLKALIVIALLPIVPALIIGLSPGGILILAIVATIFIPSFRRFISSMFNSIISGFTSLISAIFGGVFSMIDGAFKLTFGGLFAGIGWLFGMGGTKARFMGVFERGRLLSSGNNGFLVDGRSSRLSEAASYESLLVQGGVGKGKSSVFVMPNLLDPPSTKPSFVILDTSGEIFAKTSGHLDRSGYTIRALNLMDPAQSETYNPLARITRAHDLADLAKTLVSAANGGGRKGGDPFWEQAAEKLIRVLAQCLLNQPDPALRNLANLRHLVASFDGHTAPKGQLGKVDQFVLNATTNDPATFTAYQAMVQGNYKTLQSILMTADVALDPVATPEMAALTATNSIDFADLRKGPTAVYVMVNQTQMRLYKFLLNLFYADLFRALLKDEHNPGRPVWLMLDEFGHLEVPGFEVFATTARKYDVGFALFLQSLAQLEGRYGRDHAKVIREALGTEIYLPGMALDTAREIEARLGQVQSGRSAKTPLMAANEIIRMKENEALMLHSNRLPVQLKTRRYYKRGDLKRRAKRSPAALPSNQSGAPRLIQL